MPSKVTAKKTSDTTLVGEPNSTISDSKKTKSSKTATTPATTPATTTTTATTTTPVTTTTNTTANTTATTASAVTKKDSKQRGKKEISSINTTTTEAPVIENVVVASDTTDTSISDNFTEFITKFQNMLSSFNSLKTELRNLERKTVKQLKVVQKLNNKKKRKGTRAPSGFVKPSLISDELAIFLGRDKGSEMARTDVTREINKYIRANNLQDKENGRKINPDASLKALLKIDDEIALTYFNLQRYMGPHFPKQIKPVTEVSA